MIPGPHSKNRQQIIEYAKKSATVTVFNVAWVPKSARFVGVGNYPRNTGCIIIYNLARGELQVAEEVEKPKPIRCCTFGHSSSESRHLAVGDAGGNLCVWDVDHLNNPTPIFSQQAHESIINCIDGCLATGPPEIATGSRDGHVKVWDSRQPQKAITVLAPTSKDNVRDCWAVSLGNSFNQLDRCVCAGYDSGDIKLFDLRTNKMLWQTCISNGICGMSLDRQDCEMNKLMLATLEGRVRVYDMRTYNPATGYTHLEERAHNGTVWCTKPLPQNRDVFVTCGNGEISLYKYNYPAQRSIQQQDGTKKGVVGNIELLNKVTLSTQPIATFDWCKDRPGLACMASFDQTVRVIMVTKMELL
eukprot:TRINITY_DN48441_c0_g1_i1.p1 TRINITY_DN48441_c0_g1~~TRINITY_DN48441_c0_g1_i1.p1  ORF type:complete len:359 (+),score=19.25 TRINITY_DN48441_c0_g1_i1:42-1118(+)